MRVSPQRHREHRGRQGSLWSFLGGRERTEQFLESITIEAELHAKAQRRRDARSRVRMHLCRVRATAAFVRFRQNENDLHERVHIARSPPASARFACTRTLHETFAFKGTERRSTRFACWGEAPAGRETKGEESVLSEPGADRTARPKGEGGRSVTPQTTPLRLCAFAPLRYFLIGSFGLSSVLPSLCTLCFCGFSSSGDSSEIPVGAARFS